MKHDNEGTGTTDSTGMEIAVIGMAGRFPGAGNIDEFWKNLAKGVESIAFFSDHELEAAGVTEELLDNPRYVKAYGILEGIEYFDAAFFGYSPREAAVMDPQLRIIHQCAWHALEDAGYCPDSFEGLIGLYAGATANFGWIADVMLSGMADELGQYNSTQLINKDFLSLRLSYKLNLKGPSVLVQSTCSTSLLAIHMACQALLNGECDLAMAGGVTVTMLQKNGYLYQEGMIRSDDGHCRAFDSRARGTIGGNGAGMVVINRLEDALANGDHIYAVVKGSAANNDGVRKAGFTAPSIEGEAEVIMTAQQLAEVEPESITYIEAHGTGTEMGDPVEIEALKLAFNTERSGFCAVGSLKTNMGHLDSAAGVAGFIKTALALKHRVIPPSLHFEQPNPRIDFENTPFYVNTVPRKWADDGGPLRAGVSSFGIGGTNVHVILEEARPLKRDRHSTPQPGSQLILLSAGSESALERTAGNLARHLRENPDLNLADVAYTLQAGRKSFHHRWIFVGSLREEVVDALSRPGAANVFTFVNREGEKEPPVAFMFSGQGAQYVDMARGLYQTRKIFRQEMDRCLEVLAPLTGGDLKEVLYPDGSGSTGPGGGGAGIDINQTATSQPLLFCLEYSLAKMLWAWGIKPFAMIGHSVGEYVAACLAGVFSLEEALKVVALRGQLMQSLPGGAMLGVAVGESELSLLVEESEGISLAAVNSSSFCTVAGSHEAIDTFAGTLQQKGYRVNRLHTSHAFHSPMMEPMLEPFEARLRQLQLKPPSIPFLSNLTGTWIMAEEAVDPAYWRAHIRQPVRFADGVRELFKTESTLLVEIGPGNVLTTLARKHKDRQTDHFMLNLVRHPREEAVDDDAYLLTQIGKLWLRGTTVNWPGLHGGHKRFRVPLPGYPFQPDPYPVKIGDSAGQARVKPAHLLTAAKSKLEKWFYLPQWRRSTSPRHHRRIVSEKPWLIFIGSPDEHSLAERLVESLRGENVPLITVTGGENFIRLAANRFTLDMTQADHYGDLFRELRTAGAFPGKIICILDLTEESAVPLTIEGFEEAQQSGLYSLIRLVQALGRADTGDDFQVDVITNNMQEVTGGDGTRPERATLLGALQVIPQEHPHIRCRSIDIELPAAGGPGESRLVENLTWELITESPNPLIAYRGPFRWEKEWVRLETTESAEGDLPLRERGVYVITGGLGRIGLTVAEFLARHYRARLVLIGRTPLSHGGETPLQGGGESVDNRVRKVRELEELGAEVLVLNADVADFEAMRAAITRVETQFGIIHGVIHGAGQIGPEILRPVRELSPEQCRQQFHAKARGLLVLEKILQGKDVDFILLMSSVSSILGGLGFAAYAAANIFLDAMAARHNRQSRQRWLSVNWDGWNFVQDEKSGDGPAAHRTDLSMMPQEGIRALTFVLRWTYFDQVAVSTGDLDARFKRWICRWDDQKPGGPAPSQRRPDLSTTYIAPEDELQKMLAELFQNFLGIERVGVEDNFFELGLSSLDLIQINGKLAALLEREIPVVTMFTCPTIRALADHIGLEQDKFVSGNKEPVREEETGDSGELLENTIQLLEEN